MQISIERINFQRENYMHCARIPDFAQILDISFDQLDDQLEILYRYIPGNPSDKLLNIWISNSRNIVSTPTDDYHYWGKIQRQDIVPLDLSFTNNGKVPILKITETYHIFIHELKSINELRDQKIEDITNG